MSYGLSQKQLIGQFFHPPAFIHDSPEGISQIAGLIRDYHVGGLTFFYSRESVETNFDRKTFQRHNNSLQKLKAMIEHYQSLSKIPLFITIDAEWGLGMRMDDHPAFGYPLTLAATGDHDLVYETGAAIAEELQHVGVHMNLAPVADVNSNPDNPVIGYRSFGTNATDVSDYAAAYYQGMRTKGIMGAAKHFPGHGDTSVDSHLGLPVIKSDKSALGHQELLPFKRLIAEGIECVMPGHLSVPALSGTDEPASISNEMITGLLRNELGFKGIVMTDALNMKALSGSYEPGALELKAFQAGADMLSFSMNLEAAWQRIAEDASAERIATGLERVAQLKQNAGLFSANSTEPKPLNQAAHAALRTRTAKASITRVKASRHKLQTFKADAVMVLYSGRNMQVFSSKLPYKRIELTSDFDMTRLASANIETVILALCPPSDKPSAQHGMSNELLVSIKTISEQVRVRMLLFGNPYALRLFDLTLFEEVIAAYHSFAEYQQAVTDYLTRDEVPKGRLPIELHTESF